MAFDYDRSANLRALAGDGPEGERWREELHVLFGGGQVGHPLSRILLGCGKRVRIVKRSAGGLPDGVELVRGDATDPNFCVEAARGASTVYHCINPP